MESSNLNSINDLETDRASLHLPTVKVTCDEIRHFAGAKNEYTISCPPEFEAGQLPINSCQATGFHLYQCSANKQDYGSGSDSAEEEHSPYSSTEKLKFEAVAPTGNRQEKTMLRTQPPSPPDANADLTKHMRLNCPQMYKVQHKSGPLVQEIGYSRTTEALVLIGSVRGKSPYRQMIRSSVMPRGEMETSYNDDVIHQSVAAGSHVQSHNNSRFEDVNRRLATFLSYAVDWPHVNPSPEQMARAGMIYKGVFTIKMKKIYDMVECYKCGKTLYGFTENDDPVVEHRKFYPHCH